MGGITNYYHGERGLVVDQQRVANRGETVRVIRLSGNPHRDLAFDYGGDIVIDPLLKIGQQAIFVRVDTYGGIWVPYGTHFYPDLQSAIQRGTERRIRERRDPRVLALRSHGIWADQYVSSATSQAMGGAFVERPATDVSFFLSFSSANVLVARQIYEDLKHDTRVEVWFDLEQSGEGPKHKEHIANWLRDAIYSRRGFILMWTKTAARSDWVLKEIDWAVERATQDPSFRFIVLKLDGTPLPSKLGDAVSIIDCYNLWPVNGINEELFACVVGRPGRSAWLDEHRRRGLIVLPGEGGHGYEPFYSESGTAAGVRSWRKDGELCWELQYQTPSNEMRTAVGQGDAKAVDLGICRGDYVGYYVCHRAPLVRFWPGTPVWMRSAELDVQPEQVVAQYRRSARIGHQSMSESVWWAMTTAPAYPKPT